MAIYSLSVKAISRSAGRSATAAAAYRAAERIVDRRTGEVHDYRRKAGVEHAEIVAPKGAPAWARNRSELWNRAEGAERRKDSRVAREIRLALPDELDADQRKDLALQFARELVEKHRVAADVAIHLPDPGGDNRNHHAHVLFTTRRIEPDGLGEKTLEWDTRYAKEDPDPAKRISIEETGPYQIERWRERWADLANERLVEHGHAAGLDHRSFERQGVDKDPGSHLGPAASEMVRKEQRAALERGEEWNPAESQVRLVREPHLARQDDQQEIQAEEERLDSLTRISLRLEIDRVSLSSRDATETLGVLEAERRELIEARAETSDRVKGIAARHAQASRKVEGWHNRHRIQSFFVKWGFMQPKQLTAFTDERDGLAIALVDEREGRRELNLGVVHAGLRVGAQQEVLRNLQERGDLLETQLGLCEAAKDRDHLAERLEEDAVELEAQLAVELAAERNAELEAEQVAAELEAQLAVELAAERNAELEAEQVAAELEVELEAERKAERKAELPEPDVEVPRIAQHPAAMDEEAIEADLKRRGEEFDARKAEIEAEWVAEHKAEKLEAERIAQEEKKAERIAQEKERRKLLEAKYKAAELKEAERKAKKKAAAKQAAELKAKKQAAAKQAAEQVQEAQPAAKPAAEQVQEAAKPAPTPQAPRPRARTSTREARAKERRRREDLTARREAIRDEFTRDEMQSPRHALLTIEDPTVRAHAEEIFDGAAEGDGLREVLAQLEDRGQRSLVKYAARTIEGHPSPRPLIPRLLALERRDAGSGRFTPRTTARIHAGHPSPRPLIPRLLAFPWAD